MSLEFNPENRNANQQVRCCSFCRRAGHNIKRCDSQQIRIFERETLNYIQLIAREQWPTELFRRYLLDKALYAPNLIKAFAIRHCGANTRTNMVICIQLISEYFMPQIIQMIFIELTRIINEELASFNTKFHIKTKISEKKDDLHEKCECNICYDEHEKQKFIKLDCGHEFCKDCIKQTLQNERRKTPCCPFCRADIKNFELKDESFKNEFNELISSEV